MSCLEEVKVRSEPAAVAEVDFACGIGDIREAKLEVGTLKIDV